MKPLTFSSAGYRMDGVPTHLCSGEMHYFRVPRRDWRKRMRLLREAGGNALATYVPWLLHEPEEGRFVWGGRKNAVLDLEGFLNVAREEGFYVIARPGPYQYSELCYDGLPGWLCEGYPELLACNRHGDVFRRASVSYCHPLFWEKVRRWFDAVGPILARYGVGSDAACESGPIVLTQLDNELVGIHEWFGSLDFNPVTMGFGHPDGRYPRWLAARFNGDVVALNSHYGSDYVSFEAVKPPQAGVHDVHAIRRRKDYFHFYLGTVAEYARFLTDQLRSQGVNTPVIHNSGHPGMNTYFLETVAELGDAFLLGSDHYYCLDQGWPQNHPTPQYALRCLISLEELRLLGFPPTVLELPGGSCSDWPPITASDALACYLTNLAFGMKGHNYYIFTGGPNPPGAGTIMDLYDYNAGIGPAGERRALYKAQRAFGRVFAERPWLAEAVRVCDFRLALDLEHARAGSYWPEGGPHPSPAQAWEGMRTGLLTTAMCAGLSPEMVRLDDSLALTCAPWAAHALPGRGRKPLVVVTACSMAASKQQALVDYISAGGHALILPVLPWLDDDLKPCTILADYFGAPVWEPPAQGLSRATIGGVENVRGDVTAWWERLPAGAEVVGVEEYSGRPVAWKSLQPGGGTVILLSLSWRHSMRGQERMLKNLLGQLGCEPVVECSNPNVWVVAWVAGARTVLFLMNLFTAPMDAEVHVTLPDGRRVDAGRHRLAPVTVKLVDL